MSGDESPLRVLLIDGEGILASWAAQALGADAGGSTLHIESACVISMAYPRPAVAKFMQEVGLRVPVHRPGSLQAALNDPFDVVVSIGGAACKALPPYLKGNPFRIHWDIEPVSDRDAGVHSQRYFHVLHEQIQRCAQSLLNQMKKLYSPRVLAGQPGINSGLWAKEVLSERHFILAAEAGFEAMEISPWRNAAHFDFGDDDHLRRVSRAVHNTGVRVWSFHSRDVGDVTSPDPQDRQKQIDHLCRCLDAADELGVGVVVSHIQAIGRHWDDVAAAEARIAEVMEALLPRVQASCARIAIENGYGCRAGLWMRDVFSRVNPFASSAYGYVLDTGHTNVAGDLEDVEAGIGHRLISVHLNDNAGTDIHSPGGKGTVDWQRIARLLKAARYEGCLMWEIGLGQGAFTPQILADTMDGHCQLMQYMSQSQ